jgi:hypothetical protein
LKEAQKRVWPTFPIQVGVFSLSDFGHTKVEASVLEYIKLVEIEYKRHDPHRVVENHLSQFNMKIYIHKDSPYGEFFRGVRSYDEVVIRFQNLPQDKQSGFLNFQKQRKNSIPKVLQEEQILNATSQVAESTYPKKHNLPEDKSTEVEKNANTLSKEAIITVISIPVKNEKGLLASF